MASPCTLQGCPISLPTIPIRTKKGGACMAQENRSERRKEGLLSDLFQTRYPEVSLASVVFGLFFGVVLNASITYAGLKIGFTIVGSALAAVVGFGVLRGVFGRGTILEVNVGQTIASAVNSATPGIIFTVPVLWLLPGIGGVEPFSPRFWLVTLAGVVGGLLGVAFIVPLRKQMIDIDRLRFPSGTAVGAILKSPGAGPKKAMVLLAGALVATLIYLPVELPNLDKSLPGYGSLGWRLPNRDLDNDGVLDRSADHDGDGRPDLILSNKDVDVGRAISLIVPFPDYILFVFAITPLSFGAGYLTGRPGLMVLAGGILAFFVLNPLAYAMGWIPTTVAPDQVPDFGYANFNRPLGIGMLLGGALMGVVVSFPAIRAALGSIIRAGGSRRGADELGMPVLLTAILLGVFGLFTASDLITGESHGGGLLGGVNPHLRNLVIAVVGAAWIWFAGIIIAQCTGMTDWSPVSGMALLTIVLVMMLSGTQQVVAAVLIGAALCVAISCAADMMADLKTGYLIGAKPKRQQLVELVAVCIGPVITMSALIVIIMRNQSLSGGLPIGPGTDTPAPQAQALQAVILGVQGNELPYALYIAGALLGVLLGAGAFASLGVLVGLSMYLPLQYVLTYGLGCLANMAVTRVKGRVWAEEWGVPFAAGLIVGEALLAMVINIIIVLLSVSGVGG